MRTLLAAITVVVALTASCNSAQSVDWLAPAVPTTAIACLDLEPSRCELIERALPGQIPGRTPQNVEISESLCDGPCFPPGVSAWRGHVKVEFLDGAEPLFFLVEVTSAVNWEKVPTVSVRSIPHSSPMPSSSMDLEFGPCGYDTGIDADGSYWDPVGTLSWESLRLTWARARLTRTSRQTATLTLENGTIISLARHVGPKYLSPCD
jgi:hypothetical protein